jgi:hypothetical protein
MNNIAIAKLIRAMAWLIWGLRAIKNDMDEQIMEAAAGLEQLAQEVMALDNE